MGKKITIIRYCNRCGKSTKWVEYGYTNHTERYSCNKCSSIIEYQV